MNLDWVHHVAWRPDNKVFAVIGTKGTGDLKEFSVLVYDAATLHPIQTLHVKSLGSMIGTIAFSPDGKYLAAGRGVITLWDANTWQPVRDILGPYVRGFVSEGVSRMAFSPDGASLAVLYSSVSWPETVRIRFKEEAGPWLKRENESKKDGTFWEKLAKGEILNRLGTIMAFDIETNKRIFVQTTKTPTRDRGAERVVCRHPHLHGRRSILAHVSGRKTRVWQASSWSA